MAEDDKVIRVSREVWEEIQRRARRRFTETPDKVLRRVFGLGARGQPRPSSDEIDEANAMNRLTFLELKHR